MTARKVNGPRHRAITAAKRQAVLDALVAGKSQREVVETMGVSRSAVSRIAVAGGIGAKRTEVAQATVAERKAEATALRTQLEIDT